MERSPMGLPESARSVMECYLVADRSAEHNEPIGIPFTNQTLAGIAEMIKAQRSPTVQGAS